MRLHPDDLARLTALIQSGEYIRVRTRLLIEMKGNPNKFLAKRKKRGFTVDEVLVLRDMYAQFEGAALERN